MEHQQATRRGLLGGLVILPAVVTAPALAAPAASDQWAERERLFKAVGDAATDEDGDAPFERMCEVEAEILRGPVMSRSHAAAKARMVAYAMEFGQRGDGLDLASAVQLAEWLGKA